MPLLAIGRAMRGRRFSLMAWAAQKQGGTCPPGFRLSRISRRIATRSAPRRLGRHGPTPPHRDRRRCAWPGRHRRGGPLRRDESVRPPDGTWPKPPAADPSQKSCNMIIFPQLHFCAPRHAGFRAPIGPDNRPCACASSGTWPVTPTAITTPCRSMSEATTWDAPTRACTTTRPRRDGDRQSALTAAGGILARLRGTILALAREARQAGQGRMGARAGRHSTTHMEGIRA